MYSTRQPVRILHMLDIYNFAADFSFLSLFLLYGDTHLAESFSSAFAYMCVGNATLVQNTINDHLYLKIFLHPKIFLSDCEINISEHLLTCSESNTTRRVHAEDALLRASTLTVEPASSEKILRRINESRESSLTDLARLVLFVYS